LVNLRLYLVARYERLFVGRFGPGNDGRMGESVVANRLRRNRFSGSGAIFPTDPPLPRYQY
jgi:hypothetical protein